MPIPRRALRLLNAAVAGNTVDLAIRDGRIHLQERLPSRNERHIDLKGDRALPGLINAHDHLHLNHFPRLKYRESYGNASEWIEDIRPRLTTDPALVAGRAISRRDRYLFGAIKNLLCGVTTVAHHDPLHPFLTDSTFPVRVLARYGWAHSLFLDAQEVVRRSHRQTSIDHPWIIHAAEGVDTAAAEEFDRLDALGCLTANTLLVHGVALSSQHRQRLISLGAGLIWCPGSNLHLFGHTASVQEWLVAGRVALGSDSRISGECDLMGELVLAARCAGLDGAALETLVTTNAASLLRLHDRGHLGEGALADVLVLPCGLSLASARRADIRLILLGGEPQLADPEYAQVFANAKARPARIRLDGRDKLLARGLFEQLLRLPLREPGLDLQGVARASNE